MMEYFIDKGADVETGNPLAWAFCNRIRTALRIFKRYQERFSTFPEQANIALRYHCKEGNLKWVSLLLWAGADPYAPGVGSDDEERDTEYKGLSALGYAVLYQHFDIFKLKQVKLDPSHPHIEDVVRYAARGEGIDLLKQLLENGLKPNDQENGGCSHIQRLLEGMGVDFSSYSCARETAGKKLIRPGRVRRSRPFIYWQSTEPSGCLKMTTSSMLVDLCSSSRPTLRSNSHGSCRSTPLAPRIASKN